MNEEEEEAMSPPKTSPPKTNSRNQNKGRKRKDGPGSRSSSPVAGRRTPSQEEQEAAATATDAARRRTPSQEEQQAVATAADGTAAVGSLFEEDITEAELAEHLGYKGRLKFSGQQVMFKELQRLVAFRCYEKVLTDGDTKDNDSLQESAGKLYYGGHHPLENDRTRIGFAQQLCNAAPMFAALFEDHTDFAGGKVVKVMKDCFTCRPRVKIHVDPDPKNGGINNVLMHSKGFGQREFHTDRRIWEMGRDVGAQGKKFLSLVKSHSIYKTGQLPSGETYEDYLLWLRKEYSANRQSLESGDGAVPAVDEEERSKAELGDIPQGFLAFALYGPIMPDGMDPDFRAISFDESPDEDSKISARGKKLGSSRARARESKLAEEAQSRAHAPVTHGRGQTTIQSYFAASIAQQTDHSTKEREIHLLNQRISLVAQHHASIESAMERCIKIAGAKLGEPEANANNPFVKKYFECDKELEEVSSEMKDLREKLRLAMEPQAKNCYEAMIDSTLAPLMAMADAHESSETSLKTITVPRDISIGLNDTQDKDRQDTTPEQKGRQPYELGGIEDDEN